MIFGVTKLLKEKSNSEPTNPVSPLFPRLRGVDALHARQLPLRVVLADELWPWPGA